MKSPVFNILAVVFGHQLMKLPKSNFARYILMTFIIYYLVLRTIYQGGIYNILKSNQRKPELSSIDEMMAKDYDFYLYETLASRAHNFKFYEKRKVYPNDDIEIYRQKTLNPSFNGVVFTYLNQVLYINEKNYKNFTYHVSKEIFVLNNFVFYFRKNHYLVDKISAHIDLMLTAGIIQHIERKYMNPVFLKVTKNKKGPQQLKLQHFIGAFRLLLMLNAIACTIFLLEIITKFKKMLLLIKIFNQFHHRMLK